MTILQDKFIEHYVLTGNAKQSAIHAGYSEKTAKVKGSQLKAQFTNEIRDATQKLLADKVPAGLIDVASQIDTFGEVGGFDPQGGTTGSSGMGMWT